MQFAESIQLWSSFTFWFVAVNVVVTLIFSFVVVVGGISDLRFLFNALKKEPVDETDDGRVVSDQNSCQGS